ncbi:hypothetical protein GCM10010300_25310 [Streptomyces olivaceoviridis]|nr:hypothetical protein GCM10010300_25310 [Streptomyces olivaceoviridis]
MDPDIRRRGPPPAGPYGRTRVDEAGRRRPVRAGADGDREDVPPVAAQPAQAGCDRSIARSTASGRSTRRMPSRR